MPQPVDLRFPVPGVLASNVDLGKSESSLGTQIEMVERKLRSLESQDDPDMKKMEELVEERRELNKQRRIRQIERDLERAKEDDLDDFFF